jgi:hypothetical protein
MKRSFKNCLSLSFILMAHSTGSAQTLSLSEDKTGASLRLNVRVFNYAQVLPETWHLAQEVAARILYRTGIETHWLKCSLSSEGKLIPAVCEQPAEPSDLVLRLVPVSAATRAQFGDGTLGIAAQPERGTPGSASVFYNRVEQLARGGAASVPVILGHAAVHELGHLLLGSNSHSAAGLMKARWSRLDLQHACAGDLVFGKHEASSFRHQVSRHNQPPVPIASEPHSTSSR